MNASTHAVPFTERSPLLINRRRPIQDILPDFRSEQAAYSWHWPLILGWILVATLIVLQCYRPRVFARPVALRPMAGAYQVYRWIGYYRVSP